MVGTGSALPLTQRRVVQTRLEIARSALRLSLERGWASVSVADLVSASGVSARTFYRYFARKEDVFTPLLEAATARLQAIFIELDEPDVALRSAIALGRSLEDFVPGGLEAVHRSYRILLGHDDLVPVWLAAALDAEPSFASVLQTAYPALNDGHNGRLAAAVIITCQRLALVDWANGAEPDALVSLAERAIRFGLQPIMPDRV